ncbi:hypothetical protein PI124_g19857 [Phytophthora idaei]|nr:hypothetical protein PI125_g20928 [Phytophthora idaei]KAG3131993.1 hypothetical protein PI126_g19831 [Phytophthora idaei]KAG3235100.1 hypothetical protein PI124_g19857 [Phytophthora idaei]
MGGVSLGGVTLPHYDLDVWKVKRDEDGLAAIIGTGISPREHLAEIAEKLLPSKGRVKAPPVVSVEMLDASYEGVVLSFDGAAKTSTRKGSCRCVLWKLPGWSILEAQGFILEDVTVNDSEYYELLKGMSMALAQEVEELVVVGDSRIVFQQTQRLINYHQPNLQRRLAECESLKAKFKSLKLVHVKREFYQSADYLTSKTLSLGESWTVQDTDEQKHLEQGSSIPEKLIRSPGVDSKRFSADTESVHRGVAESKSQGEGTMSRVKSAPLPLAAKALVVVTRQGAPVNGQPDDPLDPRAYQAE